MPARATGVLTIAGHLTHYLDDLDLSRKDLAEMLGVSVRTVHNIEHGRKRVDRQILSQLANILNEHSQQYRRRGAALSLTEDHFISDPEAAANVFLHSIITNDCTPLFIGEEPVASANLRWIAPGKEESVPFAGDYQGWEIASLLERLHTSVDYGGIDGVKILRDLDNSIVIVRSISLFRHPVTQNELRFKAYVEIDVTGNQLGVIDSTYDSGLLAEFLRSGVAPKERKSGGLVW